MLSLYTRIAVPSSTPPETSSRISALILTVAGQHPAMPVRYGWQWLPLPHIDPYAGWRTDPHFVHETVDIGKCVPWAAGDVFAGRTAVPILSRLDAC